MHFEVLCDEGGYTNELFVVLETYMTVGQGGAGVTGCLDIHSRGREGQSLIPRRERVNNSQISRWDLQMLWRENLNI